MFILTPRASCLPFLFIVPAFSLFWNSLSIQHFTRSHNMWQGPFRNEPSGASHTEILVVCPWSPYMTGMAQPLCSMEYI